MKGSHNQGKVSQLVSVVPSWLKRDIWRSAAGWRHSKSLWTKYILSRIRMVTNIFWKYGFQVVGGTPRISQSDKYSSNHNFTLVHQSRQQDGQGSGWAACRQDPSGARWPLFWSNDQLHLVLEWQFCLPGWYCIECKWRLNLKLSQFTEACTLYTWDGSEEYFSSRSSATEGSAGTSGISKFR